MNKPDISDWYTPERALAEEVAWLQEGRSKQLLDEFLLPTTALHGVESVVEFGCASGILARGLPDAIDYLGVDANAWFLEKARRRHRGAANRNFLQLDARHYHPAAQRGVRHLAMAFSFLKHFALGEWGELLSKLFLAGHFACFNVQTLAHDLDDGVGFHHVFVRRERVLDEVRAGGHEVLREYAWVDFKLPSGERAQDVVFWTAPTGGA